MLENYTSTFDHCAQCMVGCSMMRTAQRLRRVGIQWQRGRVTCLNRRFAQDLPALQSVPLVSIRGTTSRDSYVDRW